MLLVESEKVFLIRYRKQAAIEPITPSVERTGERIN
jgi:hypothetical protein